MYIPPTSTIGLCKKVPFKNDYEHTTLFESRAAQRAYFLNKTTKTLSNQSYVRKDTGVIRVQATMSEIYDCNYMWFVNESFENHYFYAFVTKVEYENNSVCNVYFEIDVMQTWMDNYSLRDCFIERQHTITDNIGEHRISENFEHEPFYFDKMSVTRCPFSNFLSGTILIFHGTEESTSSNKPLLNNVFNGVKCERFYTPSAARNRIAEINRDEGTDGILAVLQVPGEFTLVEGDNYTELSGSNIDINFEYGEFDGYVPRNKKLYTQEFYGLRCVSSSGTTKEYALEYFNSALKRFKMYYSLGSAQPIVALYPTDYKGVIDRNLDEGIFCDDFPLCCYSADSFRAYLALNKGNLASTAFNATTSIALGAGQMIANSGLQMPKYKAGSLARKTASDGKFSSATDFTGISSILSGISTATGAIGGVYDAAKMPDKLSSGQGNGLSFALGETGFRFYTYRLTRADAERIDRYFDMFGYAVNKVGVPNTYSRPVHNYVKTSVCNITPRQSDINALPVDDMERIREIYNKGITFWRNPDNVGNYDLDNSPT